jgi:4-aminobutyrate aminotransferase-like enzyme
MSGWRFDLNPEEVPRIETKYRRVVTKIPVPESLEILEALDRYETTAMHGQLPVVWDRAEGFQVHDAWGNTWIDFTSTIFVTNAGHSNPRIVQSLREQLDKPLLHTYTFASKVRAEYLRYLIESTPPQFEKACLFVAGTEATEAALRLMRTYGWKTGKKQPGIITSEGSFHGETLGARMMSYSPKGKEWIGYHDPHIYHLPFPYPWRADAVTDPRGYFRAGMNELIKQHQLDPKRDLCGFLLETFQGWAAAFYPVEFVHELMAFARENGMLVAFDEMQSGFGRTGKLFGYMHYSVEPELLCCGKGASSSMPLSMILGSREVLDLPGFGDMFSTHSANPLACAAGLANLHVLLEDGLIENARILGELFQARLEAIANRFPKHIRCALGKGLVVALHFVDSDGKPLTDLCNRICLEAMRRGLLVVHTGRESIKLAPPLSINEEALEEGLTVLEEAIGDCIREDKR